MIISIATIRWAIVINIVIIIISSLSPLKAIQNGIYCDCIWSGVKIVVVVFFTMIFPHIRVWTWNFSFLFVLIIRFVSVNRTHPADCWLRSITRFFTDQLKSIRTKKKNFQNSADQLIYLILECCSSNKINHWIIEFTIEWWSFESKWPWYGNFTCKQILLSSEQQKIMFILENWKLKNKPTKQIK